MPVRNLHRRTFRLRQDHAGGKLVRNLSDRGMKIATISTPTQGGARHARQGQLSLQAAGASMSPALTRDALQLVADAVDEREPEQLARRFMGEADLVLRKVFHMRRALKLRCCVAPVASRRAAPLKTT